MPWARCGALFAASAVASMPLTPIIRPQFGSTHTLRLHRPDCLLPVRAMKHAIALRSAGQRRWPLEVSACRDGVSHPQLKVEVLLGGPETSGLTRAATFSVGDRKSTRLNSRHVAIS